jgi:hypothetical protein
VGRSIYSKKIYVDSEFRSIVVLFSQEAVKRGVVVGKVSVLFDLEEEDAAVAGTCYTSYLESFIRISNKHWEVLSNVEKEMLLFHELAHCLIGRMHCETTNNKIPISIMYPDIIDQKIYEANRKEYVDELFKADSRCD